jgi:tetratricopeptide (TPR) repeat protein
VTTPRPKKKASAGPPEISAATPARAVEARTGWLVAAAALSAAIIASAAFFPALRLWGVNHLAFLPPTARYAAIALLVLAFIPFIAAPVYRGACTWFDRIGVSRRGTGARVLIVGLACAATAGFWAARSSTLLLGDGQLLVRSFEAAERGYEKVIMRSASAIMNEEVIAPGTTLTYYAAIKTGKHFKQPPLNSMRALNCVLGGLLILVLGSIVTRNFARGEVRLWLLLLALGSCSLELFFGYIENYTTPTFLLMIYVVLALRALHGHGRAWVAGIPLVMACYAHIQSILFLPSFVYLVLWTYTPQRRPALLRYWTLTFTTVAFVGIISAPLVEKMRKFYVPLGFSNEKYALFSPNHLADIANELFILLPILPVVAAMAWIGRSAERASGRDATRDARALKTPTEWFTHPAEWQLVSTILIPCAFYIAFFHPEIGMARDWDLFTMTATALVPFVLLVLNRYLRATELPAARVARFAVPSLLVALISSAAWVGVNASTERTMARFQSILTYDQTHAAYAWETLAMLQHDRKELDAAIATMRIAYDHSRNPRQGARLAVYLDEAGHSEEAKQIARKILEKHPDATVVRFRLLMFLEKEDNWTEIMSVARDGVKYTPDDGVYYFFYGEALLRSGDVKNGVEMFRKSQEFKLPADITNHVNEVLKQYGEQPAPTTPPQPQKK